MQINIKVIFLKEVFLLIKQNSCKFTYIRINSYKLQ